VDSAADSRVRWYSAEKLHRRNPLDRMIAALLALAIALAAACLVTSVTDE
jgi:hypothetical protein